MQRRHILKLVTLGPAALALAACGGGAEVGAGGGDVLGVADASGLDRFLRAVEAAGLSGTLAGPGPFTVFAPSDRAFAGRPLPSDRETLRRLVAYHVVPGAFTTEFLLGMDVNYTTAAGTSVNVDGTDGLRVNGANVLSPDLAAANGVVHVIDRVLEPR